MPRGAGEIVMWLNNNKQSRKSTYSINESRIQYGHESAHWKLLSKQSQKGHKQLCGTEDREYEF